jgi:virulence-associated protein VagC
MQTVKILKTSTGQAVPLPVEFQFETPTVSIRRQGDAVILEPVKSTEWPDHFFENIRIDDTGFVRPDQGSTPPAPAFE